MLELEIAFWSLFWYIVAFDLTIQDTFTNAAILMIIAISVLNFSVKFLVTKHTQIIYFSYNVFKRAENILEKG